MGSAASGVYDLHGPRLETSSGVIGLKFRASYGFGLPLQKGLVGRVLFQVGSRPGLLREDPDGTAASLGFQSSWVGIPNLTPSKGPLIDTKPSTIPAAKLYIRFLTPAPYLKPQ